MMNQYLLVGREIMEIRDPDEYARLSGSSLDSGKRVAEDTVGPWWISTVFLNIDHRIGGGTPVLFETMVFEKGCISEEHKEALQKLGFPDLDNYMDRYCTIDEAERGHIKMVEWVRGVHDELVNFEKTNK